MPEQFDLALGPLRFRTIEGDVTEPLGDALEAVGAALTAAERRPRAFDLTLPVRGPRDVIDQAAQGERLRRQVRALLNNPQARMAGLYLAFAADPDLDGWMIVGGGDLSYGDQGPSHGAYTLKLTDAYRVATTRTHRAGRRLTAYDRRQAGVALDTLGRFFGPVWPSLTPTIRHTLPIGVTDVVMNGGTPVATSTRAGQHGAVSIVGGGEIIDFEQAPADYGKADVVIRDRRGSGDESEWEEIYGRDQALTPGDIPVLDNGIVRIRYDTTRRVFAVDRWTSGAWAEQGRFAIRLVAGAANPTMASLVGAHVIECTPERAVLRAVFTSSSAHRVTVLLTLQSGWLGPRVEIYPVKGPTSPADTPHGQVRWSPAVTGSAFTTSENHAETKGTTQTLYAQLAAVQDNIAFSTATDSEAYGTDRTALVAVANGGTAPATAAGYLSAHVSVTVDPSDFSGQGRAALSDCRQLPTLIAR